MENREGTRHIEIQSLTTHLLRVYESYTFAPGFSPIFLMLVHAYALACGYFGTPTFLSYRLASRTVQPANKKLDYYIR